MGNRTLSFRERKSKALRLKYLTLPIIALAIGLAIHFAPANYVQAGGNDDNVTICHHTSSAQNTWVTITVAPSALPAHFAHGDTLGPCAPLPTATHVPPTATHVPSTATSVPPTSTAVPPTSTAIPPTNTPPPPSTATAVPTAVPTVTVLTSACELYTGLIAGQQFFQVWATVTRVNGNVTSAAINPSCVPLTSTTSSCEFLSQGPFGFISPGWYSVTRVNGAIANLVPAVSCQPIQPPVPQTSSIVIPAPQIVVVPVPAVAPAVKAGIAPPRTGDGGLLDR